MKIHKWYTPLIIGLALILSASLAACNKSEESPYAPDFTLQTINGETVSLSDFSGKPTLAYTANSHVRVQITGAIDASGGVSNTI